MEELEINMENFVSIVGEFFNSSEINSIIEIGSLNGKDSLFFKEKFPDATVYCIEGLPDNFNEYIQGLNNIKSFNIVIADYDGEVNYHVKNINGLHGILNRGDIYGDRKITLPCKKMKTFCTENNIKNIDMLKIDVEGATYQILKSFEELLDNIKIMHIETESYPFFIGQVLHDDVSNFLIENNFELVKITSVEIEAKKTQHDSVWVNKKFKK